MRCGFCLQQLGVPRETDVCSGQRLFVQRRGHDRRYLAGQRGACCPSHAVTCGTSGYGANLARYHPHERRNSLEHRHAALRHPVRRRHRFDERHRQRHLSRTTQGLTGSSQSLQITNNDTTAREFGRIAKSLHDDLGTDAGGVAECDGDRFHAGLSMSMNSCTKPSCVATWPATA